jgi:tetratricopeptide (TPR) repeat protein
MIKTKTSKSTKEAKIVSREKVSLVTVALFLLIIGVFAAAAHTRNRIYRSHVDLWEDVTTRSPSKRRAHENYGQALSTAGSIAKSEAEAKKYYDEALRQFQTVLSLKDDGSVPMRDLYREIGVVYFRVGRYQEAIDAWQTGLRHAPNDPSLLNNLSIVLMQQGRMDEAAAQAQTALTVDPYMPQALNTMGQVAMMKKEYDKAVQYFMRSIEREPDVAARYWNVALALEQAGKYDMALQYANSYAAMEQDPAARQRAVGLLEYLKKKTGK